MLYYKCIVTNTVSVQFNNVLPRVHGFAKILKHKYEFM